MGRDLRPYLNSIVEPGCTRAYGAWTDGHVDKADFLGAVSSEYNRLLSMPSISHGYYRVLRGVMHFTAAKGRGATPVTWAEW